MNKVVILLLLGLVSRTSAFGQVVHFPDGPGSWTVACTAKGTPPASEGAPAEADGPPKPPVLKSVEVAQTTDASRTILRWANGRTRELWSFPGGGSMLTEDPNGTAFSTRNSTMFGNPFGPSGFDWIKPESKKNDAPVKVDGKDCDHYVGSFQLPTFDPKQVGVTVFCEAWIETKTQLPVVLIKDDVVGKYSFGPPPASLEMPAKFKQLLEYNKMAGGR